MFKKLIVGVDGREGGADAVALARTLAADDAEILLVSVIPSEYPSLRGESGYKQQMREHALAGLAKEGDDPRFVPHPVFDDSPARVLHVWAEKEDADAIVLGSCRRGVVGRMLLGDVSRAVLHDAPCAVVVAPGGYRKNPGTVRIVGVGLEESDAAQAAADFATRLAADQGAGLQLLTVLRIPTALNPGYAPTYDLGPIMTRNRDVADTLQAARLGAAEAAGTRATGTVVDGVAADELEKLSKDVDVLVLGSRGWGAVKRVVLGSTADRVVHHAACPVILVPGPAHVQAAATDHPSQTTRSTTQRVGRAGSRGSLLNQPTHSTMARSSLAAGCARRGL